MSIFVEKSGVLTTVQDAGRRGFRRFGINPNGAMDATAARLINILLNNDETAAVLEMHFPAPVLRFETPAIAALGGANFAARRDDEPIENWRPFFIEKNQTLTFAEKVSGNRAYLAVEGGFKVERWLGSSSTNLAANIGGFDGRAVRKGDCLDFNYELQIPDFEIRNPKSKIQNSKFAYKISERLIPPYTAKPTLRVVAGAEFERLTAKSELNFLKNDFTVSRESDRMGFRLRGAPLFLLDAAELVSSAVERGTIQLTPGGQMIVLMADAQTSGGYPRLAHVASGDLPLLAQLGAGDAVDFRLISVAEAENLIVRRELDLNSLRIGVDYKNAENR